MQQTLTVEIGGKNIVSKPFDFEAMCLADDVFRGAKNRGYLSAGKAAVYHMFEGTEATNDVLKKLALEEMAKLCTQAWDFYVEAVNKAAKNG